MVLDSVEDSAAILAVFNSSGIWNSTSGGREPHEASEADAALDPDHDPDVTAAHPFVELQELVIDLLREAFTFPLELLDAMERESKLLLLGRALGVLGLPDQEIQVL